MANIGKRSAKANEVFAGKSLISVEDAVKLIKGAASAKFEIEFGRIKDTRRMHAIGNFRSYELANDAAYFIAEFHHV